MTEQSQTLYRKWRSQTFSELVGQEAVTRTLRQAVASGRLTHAYLFCGPRGTGKTSTARLLAKMINCADPRDGEPCNACLACREITEGRSVDVIEIDAASNRGIDDIRNLRDRVRVTSAHNKTRVFVIDEIHMLTTEAFNALLKTLEEPPPQVVFVLATTDPQKIPETVISRCQRFDFRRITVRDLVGHLSYVAEQEGMQIERGAVELIARAARGGMRDGLSLLDQVRAFAGETISAEATRQMLGLADPAQIRDLVIAVAEGDTSGGLHRIHDLAQSGADLRQLAGQVGELWRQLMLARAGADVVALLDIAPEDGADLKQLASRFPLEALTESARIFARNDAGPHTQIVPQLALELAFLDCVTAMRPRTHQTIADDTTPYSTASAPIVSPPTAMSPTSTAALPKATLPPISMPVARPSAPPPAPSAAESLPWEDDAADTLATDARPDTSRRGDSSASPPPATSFSPVGPVVDGSLSTDQDLAPSSRLEARLAGESRGGDLTMRLRTQWEMFRKIVKQRSNRVYGILGNAHCSRVDANQPVTAFIGTEFEFHFKELSLPEHREAIAWALEQVLEQPCLFTIVQEKDAPPVALRETGRGTPPSAPASPTAPANGHATNGQTPNSATPQPPAELAPSARPSRARPTGDTPSTSPTGDPRALAEQDPVVKALKANFGGTVRGIVRQN